MYRFLAPSLLLSLAFVAPAHAQMEFAGSVPQHGVADQDARSMIWARMNAPEHIKVNCWKLGCVLIVNETAGYDVVGFYVDNAKPGKKARWSNNEFREPLLPSKATLRFKAGGLSTCSMPVRFVLRKRDSDEKAEINGVSSFCTSPHNDTLIRIKMQEGKVYVRGDDEPDPNETH